MKVLAIDTSTWSLGVAVSENGKVLGETNTNQAKNHSLRLMPAVEWLLSELQIKPQELDGIAVAHGPGSYTGVRIGVTTAKTLAYSLGIPIIGISSLQVMAQNRVDFKGYLVPLIDARRGQAYTGLYAFDQQQKIAVRTGEERIQIVRDFVQELKELQTPCLFMGEGLEVHDQLIRDELGSAAYFGREVDQLPKAGQLAFLAQMMWDQHHQQDVHQFVPQYLQLAEAEAKWLKKQGETC